jgi:predicted acylesterase/phospholipase RssA
MTNYGFVASGGGYRSFYTEGALVWMQQNNIPIARITSTSSGNNIVLDYLLWDWQKEKLPPVLNRTLRLNIQDIFHVFANFLGLQPSLVPNGTYLFTVDKDKCRKSLLLDEPERRAVLKQRLSAIKWDILTTNLSKKKSKSFNVNEILSDVNDSTLARFMDVFLAGITTIPYFKAITMDDDYYIEGGYIDNTPLRTLFEDPGVDEIIAVDFTDYDYHSELSKAYASTTFTLPLNSIDLFILVSDIQLNLPNASILSRAVMINQMLKAVKRSSIELDGKTYFYKPLHILKPKNLESMTISLKHSRIQKEYYELGQKEIQAFFADR